MKPHTYLKACLANEGSGILKDVRFDPTPPKEKDSQSTKFIRHSFKKLFLVYKAKRKQDVLEKEIQKGFLSHLNKKANISLMKKMELSALSFLYLRQGDQLYQGTGWSWYLGTLVSTSTENCAWWHLVVARTQLIAKMTCTPVYLYIFVKVVSFLNTYTSYELTKLFIGIYSNATRF